MKKKKKKTGVILLGRQFSGTNTRSLLLGETSSEWGGVSTDAPEQECKRVPIKKKTKGGRGEKRYKAHHFYKKGNNPEKWTKKMSRRGRGG